jgi:hypothetical protein
MEKQMDQANQQSSVQAAADAMLGGGFMDSIDEEGSFEPENDDVVESPESEIEDEDQESDESDDQTEGEEAEESTEDDETEQTDDDAESDSDEEQFSFDTVEQLAENLGISEEELLGKLSTTITVDGQKEVVTLRDALDGRMKDADYRRKTSILANDRREFESSSKQEAEKVDYQHQVAANVLMVAEKQLKGEMQGMDELRHTDPVAWATKRADLIEREQSLQQLKQHAAQAYMQQKQERDEKDQNSKNERLSIERDSLMKLIPNFSDVKPKLEGYLSNSYGFSNDELGTVADHRLIDMARKAMLYDQQATKTEVAKKKVKLAPKMQKPTRAAPQNSSAAQQRKSAMGRAKKSGHINDAASAIESFLD